MREKKKNALIPLIFTVLVFLLIYGFAILRGEWLSLLMGIIFSLLISKFFDEYSGKAYFPYIFSILIFVFAATLIFVNLVRNNSSEKIDVQGTISKINNSYKYVHFELKEYPDISFKSYDFSIRTSFKKYTADSYYEKKPINLGKKARLIIYKSHLEWCRKPYVAFLRYLRFPLEIEIESFETIE